MFCKVRDRLKKNFDTLVKDKTHLYTTDIDKDKLYDLYLNSFADEDNKIYRERTEHDCSCCKQFIRNIGNVVAITDRGIKTIWDFDTETDTYNKVFSELDSYVKNAPISDVYLSETKNIGTKENYELAEDGTSTKWEHFYLELPREFTLRKDTIPTRLGRYRDAKNVFKRSLDEITLEAIDTVIELSESNTLYKGTEWLSLLKELKKHKLAYDKTENKDLYTWGISVTLPESLAKIRNTSIGTLLIDISEGKDLDTAVSSYETITAPMNYKRSKPIFTQRMLDEAKKTIDTMGYSESLARRFAVESDISVKDVLFVNKSIAKSLSDGDDIFAELSKTVKATPKKFSNTEEIPVDKFIKDVLPAANEIELYFDNRHSSNLVSLVSPMVSDAKPLFKWGTNYSWAYNGNLTDSMKQRVKSAGGKVDGDLRFSIQWNESGRDDCDLDAHCNTPVSHIYYCHKKTPFGELDVDIRTPGKEIAVENITFETRHNMPNGTYLFYVKQYAGVLRDGFKAEIEFDGVIHTFNYPHTLKVGDVVKLAEVTLQDGTFKLKTLLNSTETSKEIWNLKTNTFVPVNIMCYSPNFWDTVQNKVGHKHLFFMLKDCISKETPSGIFNEFLVQDLYNHRRVMEALGSKMRVEPSDTQLSGVGFALDKRDNVLIKVKGTVERVFKVMI